MESFFGIGILELFFIAILALIIMGPERLPGVMREGANYIRKLRQMGNELTSQFSDELNALDELNPKRIFNEMTDPNRPDPNAKTKPAPTKTPPPAKPAVKPASTAPAKTAATKPATTQSTTTAASASAVSAVVTDTAPQPVHAENTILPPVAEKPVPSAAAPVDEAPTSPGANGVSAIAVTDPTPDRVESQA
jgi:sec-independent protein translocase protein TatB